LSIRKKLFVAFALAAVLPLVALGVLARLYLDRARVDVEQRFLEHARQAVETLDGRACGRTDILYAAIVRLAKTVLHGEIYEEPSVELKIFAPEFLETPAGQAALKKPPRKIEVRVTKSRDHILDEVRRFRSAHPSVKSVKVMVDGETVYSDLEPEVNLSVEALSHTISGDDPDAPFQIVLEGRRFLVTREIDGVRVAAEIDPPSMLDPASVSGVRAFYVEADGKLRHPPSALELLKDVPFTAIARQLPGNGETRIVLAIGAPWRVYSAVSGERDKYNYGGDARLIAVAPQSLVEAPLERFRIEVASVALLSLLVALGLSYYLSGRFTESVENLKRGVDALSRGEFAELEKSSGDELGGELVESMNRMAKELAERTRREEVEGWRRLVRVLSHEINNTLGPVKSVASTVRDQLAPKLEGETGDDLKSAFRLIVDRVDSLSSFISGYAVLAKLPPPERAPGDFNEVVRGAVSMLREQAGQKQLILDESYDSEIVKPMFDGQQIERVAINLVKNAVEAARTSVLVRTTMKGTAVELHIEDDGPGIAAEARPHLFVPYYTTKPGGSGIGLALARQIILGHGGTIAVRDRDGGGTIASVLIPTGPI
jgi:signal transduction histidine kinase